MRLRWSPEFRDYVAKADEGRNSGLRIAVGFTIIMATFVVGAIALFIGVVLILVIKNHSATAGGEVTDFFLEQADLLLTDTPFGLGISLISFGFAYVGVWLAVRFVHRRQLSSLLGTTGSLSRSDFLRSFGIWFAVSAVSALIWLGLDDTAARSETELSTWFLAAAPLAVLVLLQSSAEEVVVRGYLQQSLANRFPRWIIWLLVPTLIFTLLHWDPEVLPWMNGGILANVAAFSVAMTVLVYKTGNLGAAIGAHFANNVVAFFLVSAERDYRSLAVFVGRPIQDASWTITDAVIVAVSGVLFAAIPVALSLHPRSPFRLQQRAPEVLQTVSPRETA